MAPASRANRKVRLLGRLTRRKYDHPAQKPVDPVRRSILNRTRRGWPTYNPFLGPSTKLAAAELTVRLCLAVQLDAKYVDVMVQRWQTRNGGRPSSRDGKTFTRGAEGNLRNLKLRCVLARSKWRDSARR